MKKKTTFENPLFECLLGPSLPPEGVSTEARTEAEDSTLVLDDQLVDLIAPESGINFDV